MAKKFYNGYLVLNRNQLLADLKALDIIEFSKVIAHHVTWEFGIGEIDPPPVFSGEAYGWAKDEKIQALAVKLILPTGEAITTRPDSRQLHVTLSLDPLKAKPVDSNKLFENSNSLHPYRFELELEPMLVPLG